MLKRCLNRSLFEYLQISTSFYIQAQRHEKHIEEVQKSKRQHRIKAMQRKMSKTCNCRHVRGFYEFQRSPTVYDEQSSNMCNSRRFLSISTKFYDEQSSNTCNSRRCLLISTKFLTQSSNTCNARRL